MQVPLYIELIPSRIIYVNFFRCNSHLFVGLILQNYDETICDNRFCLIFNFMQVTDLFIWKRFHWYGANCHKFVNPHFVWFSRVFNIFGLYMFNLFGFLPFLTILFHYPFACLNNCFTFVFIFQWNNQRVLTATIINIQEDLTLFEFNFILENSGTQILSFYERNILSFFRFSDNWSV